MTNNEQHERTRDVVVTRVFAAPIDQVWRAWSDAAYVRHWWGPIGFTCPLARMDFREGGVSLVCMRAPQEYGGQDMYSTWTYTLIVPHARIEYIFNFADQAGTKLVPAALGLPPGIPEDGHHIVTFRDLGAKRTEMTVQEQGYTTDLAHDTSKAGLEQCLDKMAAIVAGA